MQWIIAAVVGALSEAMSSLVGRALVALGISFVTYQGFDVGIEWLLDQIKSNIDGMPAEVISFLGWLWVDKAIGMMFSAYSAALSLKMVNGQISRMVQG